jgi:FdrA protein
MIFSDNVPLDAEIELKRRASSQGLLVMGPDCGTAMIGGVALGFGNRVRRGPIGIVAAAGTGIQEVTSLIHRYGAGISHAIGTGARDLSASVGGSTTVLGLAALAEDSGTAVIVLISKPPAPEVAARVLGMAAGLTKPVVVHIIGAEVAAAGGLHIVGTLDEAARVAVGLTSGAVPEEPGETVLEDDVGFAATQKHIRGLYSGGTLCYEALVLLEGYVGTVHSNTPLDPAFALASPMRSVGHTVIDMGSDEFTVGRLHPMLDLELRIQRLIREAEDPEVAILLLDVVLGFGAHHDPVGVLAPSIRQAREHARAPGSAVAGDRCGLRNRRRPPRRCGAGANARRGGCHRAPEQRCGGAPCGIDRTVDRGYRINAHPAKSYSWPASGAAAESRRGPAPPGWVPPRGQRWA